ncbi:MAG: N-acetylmuramidase family protein [Muribaculaceae bacterium]|nr:N-acetylmuramidase family protein [Muribaculaceae bacterium]
MKKTIPIALITAVAATASLQCGIKPAGDPDGVSDDSAANADSIAIADSIVRADSLAREESARYERLSDEDYAQVAKEMGVEVAAIKAVVDIEAGAAHKGFWAPGKPLINFDLSIYRKMAPKHGLNLAALRKSNPMIFAAPNIKKYGSQQAAEQAILDAAAAVDTASAWESTFWGMFQIGGFNYKLCGYGSVQEFVEAMSYSEHEQLEIFAHFCDTLGYTKYIRSRDWAGFSRRYNGPSYKSRRYDTRMAAAYRKYSAR